MLSLNSYLDHYSGIEVVSCYIHLYLVQTWKFQKSTSCNVCFFFNCPFCDLKKMPISFSRTTASALLTLQEVPTGGFFWFFLIGESEVHGQPAAAKKTRNYKSTFVIYASSKDERGIFSALPRFQFFFLKLLKTCEQRSEIPLREHLLSLSVIKSCSI